MANNRFINYFFSEGAKVDPEEQFNLSRKSKSRRLREIISIMQKHHFLDGFTPETFRAMLEDLGPSFVKVGQTLAARSEILPKAYCEELKKLQTKCDPLPFDLIMRELHLVYGDKFDEIFVSVDPKPLGSASLAQVHKAKLVSGETVAVKVQRPGVKETMAQDIDIMRSLAKTASAISKDDQMLDLREVVEEMWATFLEETDFECEAENLQEFALLNKDVAYIDCPKVYPELCNENVLVMEYIDGIPIYDEKKLKEQGYDLEEIGRKILDNYAKQILDDGFFHADPHAGNILIRDGKIVYIDLGIMGRLSSRDRVAFGEIIKAVGMNSSSELKDALISFASPKDSNVINHSKFLADLDMLLEIYGSCDVSEIDIGQFLNDIVALTRAYKVTLPSSITSIARGIVTIEGTVASFIPSDSVMGIINDHLRHSKSREDELIEAIEDLTLTMRLASRGMVETAEYSGETLKMLTRGQLKLNMEMTGSEEPLSKVSKIMNRLTIGIIIAGLFIGSSLMAFSDMAPSILGAPAISFLGYLGAAILSIWVVVDIYVKK